MGDYILLQDAAKDLSVHPQTLRLWIKAGRISAFRRPGKGNRVFLKADEIEKLKTFESIKTHPIPLMKPRKGK